MSLKFRCHSENSKYAFFVNPLNKLFLSMIVFIISFLFFATDGYAEDVSNNLKPPKPQFLTPKGPPPKADEIEANKAKASHDALAQFHAITYGYDQFQPSVKLGCSSASIVDGLRDYDEVFNKWFKYDDASIKFENNFSTYDPDKLLKPDGYENSEIKSIAKIQFLPDFYLTSTSAVKECKKNGCEVRLMQFSPFSISYWLSIWVDENSFVEFDYKSRGVFRYSLERLDKFKNDDYSYSIVIQGSKNLKNYINQMSFYIRVSDLEGIECTEDCEKLPIYNGANKSKYKPWLPLYSVSAFYSDHIKKSCRK